MITTSSRFHEAIRNDRPQFPLFIFNDGRLILPEDIDLDSGGFKFSDTVMDSEDYKPGATASSTLSFNLLNDSGAWTDYEYGEFTAWLGVQIYREPLRTEANCQIKIGSKLFEGYSRSPYLRLNGSGVTGPAKPILSMLLIGDKLYAFADGTYYVLQYTGTRITLMSTVTTLDSLMFHSRTWNRTGESRTYGYKWADDPDNAIHAENALMVFTRNYEEHYEMIRLGVFTADRPVFASDKTIAIDCFDRMVKFDEMIPDGTFEDARTLSQMTYDVATAMGIQYALPPTGVFANADAVITNPDLGECTYRDLLRYIGELSGTYARMTRDGRLQMSWFHTVNYSMDAHGYSDCQIGYYNVAPIDKVVIRSYDADDIESGDGTNVLYISNNPLAKVISTGGDT